MKAKPIFCEYRAYDDEIGDTWSSSSSKGSSHLYLSTVGDNDWPVGNGYRTTGARDIAGLPVSKLKCSASFGHRWRRSKRRTTPRQLRVVSLRPSRSFLTRARDSLKRSVTVGAKKRGAWLARRKASNVARSGVPDMLGQPARLPWRGRKDCLSAGTTILAVVCGYISSRLHRPGQRARPWRFHQHFQFDQVPR